MRSVPKTNSFLICVKQSFLGDVLRFVRTWVLRLIVKPKFNEYKTNSILFLADGRRPTFFGYHDKTPVSADGSKILAMSVVASDKKPESECTPMKLGYFAKKQMGDFENNFIPFAETITWGWQQGCMLQWHPMKLNSQVVFNTLVDGAYGSVVFDIDQGVVVKKYKNPIYAIDPKGKLAATLNFSHLGRLRPGYGYGLLADSTSEMMASEDDGLFVFALETGEKRLLVSLAALANEIKQSVGYDHYINHATFSPDGKRIAFFYLSVDSDSKKSMRFFAYKIETHERLLIEDKKTVSHYCWISNENVLATVQGSEKNSWVYCTYRTEKAPQGKRIDLDLKTDGHPMRSPVHKNLFVTDSRLNRRRDDYIILFNKNNYKIVYVNHFFIPTAYRGQVRCDLHPRWDREGKFIVADVVEKGKRAMAVVNVQAAIEEVKNDK